MDVSRLLQERLVLRAGKFELDILTDRWGLLNGQNYRDLEDYRAAGWLA